MRITGKMAKEDDLRYGNCNIIMELCYSKEYVPDRRYIANADLRYFAWLSRTALKEIQRLTKSLAKQGL